MTTFGELVKIGLLFAAVLITCATVLAAIPEDLPDAEKQIANTVDPWGLPFGDQLTQFRGRFTQVPMANYCVGITHDLVKIWPNKYWFRGQSYPTEAGRIHHADTIWAASGTTASFQIAILPRVGAPGSSYHVDVSLDDNSGLAQAELFREVFVVTAQPAYPRFNTERWPDPLVPEDSISLEEGLEPGVFWIDVHLPTVMPTGRVICEVKVGDGTQDCHISVPIQIIGDLDLKPKAYPFIGWFHRQSLSEQQFRDMCGLVLDHHMMPVDALKGVWNVDKPQQFDEFHQFLADRGMTLFDIGSPNAENFDALYAHIKQQGWLDQCIVYSNADEPDYETFVNSNIPFQKMVHDKYPGLRVYLASPQWHPNMEQGCDIWMTDLSSATYDPERHKHLKQPQLWHYYCHLPVRWQMRAPLVLAPNMQIDNPAIEHRLAFWMSWYYGAKGVFTWAGFAGGPPADFWETLRLSDKPSGFPYAGIHNGNNFRVYPPREEGGPVLPSLRLKVTRAGLEDLALLAAVQQLLDEGRIAGEHAQRLTGLLNPVPELFVDIHYFDPEPETLLERREQILRTVAAALAE